MKGQVKIHFHSLSYLHSEIVLVLVAYLLPARRDRRGGCAVPIAVGRVVLCQWSVNLFQDLLFHFAGNRKAGAHTVERERESKEASDKGHMLEELPGGVPVPVAATLALDCGPGQSGHDTTKVT